MYVRISVTEDQLCLAQPSLIADIVDLRVMVLQTSALCVTQLAAMIAQPHLMHGGYWESVHLSPTLHSS